MLEVKIRPSRPSKTSDLSSCTSTRGASPNPCLSPRRSLFCWSGRSAPIWPSWKSPQRKSSFEGCKRTDRQARWKLDLRKSGGQLTNTHTNTPVTSWFDFQFEPFSFMVYFPRSLCVFWLRDLAQQGGPAGAATQRHGSALCGASQRQPGRNSAVRPAWRTSRHGPPHQPLLWLYSGWVHRKKMICDQMLLRSTPSCSLYHLITQVSHSLFMYSTPSVCTCCFTLARRRVRCMLPICCEAYLYILFYSNVK